MEYLKKAEKKDFQLHGYRKEYVCKVASLEEMNSKWDYEIAHAGEDRENWVIWKKSSIEHMLQGSAADGKEN